MDRQGLKEVLHKYKDSFAKDSLDCGLTNIHTVRIPTNPNAPPTFLRQFKIPIASNEPVQEIIDSMLEKGVIRPCNSTYSTPIRSNHAKRMLYDHGARSHNTYLTDIRCTTQQNRKNHHNYKLQITGTSRRMCLKECPQHMSMAAPTIVWSGSTTTRAHRNNSN